MSRATIDDQKDFARRVLDQAFPECDQEFDESGRAAARRPTSILIRLAESWGSTRPLSTGGGPIRIDARRVNQESKKLRL
jgi:hypothetical protein